MGCTVRVRRAGGRTVLALVALSAAAPAAFAQAWAPPAGVGIISVVYQDVDNTNHRLTDGSLFDGSGAALD